MLSVTYRPFMLSVIMLNVVMLSVVMMNVLAPAKWLLLWSKHQLTALYCSIGLIVYNQSMNVYV
jgi:hypothetical protein